MFGFASVAEFWVERLALRVLAFFQFSCNLKIWSEIAQSSFEANHVKIPWHLPLLAPQVGVLHLQPRSRPPSPYHDSMLCQLVPEFSAPIFYEFLSFRCRVTVFILTRCHIILSRFL